jgi:hypothetical protein
MIGLFLLLQVQVSGLHPGESFRPIPLAEAKLELWPNAIESQCKVVVGRVIDAFTRRPVVGAVVEAWTEELNFRAAGHEQFGSYLTGADGVYYLPQAGKGRVLAAGYYTATTVDVHYGDVIELFPIDPDMPDSQIRFVDTDGQPIAGVRVTSTLSCSHDIYAMDVRSGADGIAHLPNYGFQPSPPELRFRAAGFRGVEYYYGQEPWQRNADGSICEVVLPRMQRPIRFQLLRADGTVAAGVPMHLADGPNYHIVRTDEQGRVNIGARFGGIGINPIPFGPDPDWLELPNLNLNPDREVALRLGGEDWAKLDQTLPTGLVRMADLPVDADPYLPSRMNFSLLHEDGWFDDLSAKQLKAGVPFPAGKISLLADAFNGWAETIDLSFELAAGQVLELNAAEVLKPKRSIKIEWPDEALDPWLQHNGVTFNPKKSNTLFLVPDQPLVAHWAKQGVDYYQHISADKLKAVDRLVLDPELAQSRPDLWATEGPASHAYGIVSGPHIPDHARTWISADRSGESDCVVRQSSHGSELFCTGPAGSNFLASVNIDDYRPAYLRGQFPDTVVEHSVTKTFVEPVKSASLEMVSVRNLDFQGDLDPDWLNELDPGPLSFTLIFDEEFAYRLDLFIEPGDKRSLIFSD